MKHITPILRIHHITPVLLPPSVRSPYPTLQSINVNLGITDIVDHLGFRARRTLRRTGVAGLATRKEIRTRLGGRC